MKNKVSISVIRIVSLLFLALIIKGCEKSTLQNDSEVLETSENLNNIINLKTISLEESLSTIKQWRKTVSNKSSNPIGLNFDESSYKTEELTNTNAKLAVISASTKYDDIISELWQLKYEGTILNVLMHTFKSGHGEGGIYNGLSIITDFEGKIFAVYEVEDSKIISEIIKDDKSADKTNSKATPCWGFHCPIWTLEEVIVYPQAPNYIHTSSPWIGNGHIFTGINPANQYRGYNWGAQYAYIALTNITFVTVGKKINPTDELKCFKTNQGGKLTVYVQQPKEKSDGVMEPNKVGHAFVGIQQGNHQKMFGFYPPESASNVPIAVGNSYVSELRDNSNTLYHVSISTNINASQMSNILNYVKNYPSTYDLNSYACTDFAIKVGNLWGLNLPSTTVEYFTFKGRSPGKLGEEIRAMNSNSKKTVKKTKGTSPSNSKTKC